MFFRTSVPSAPLPQGKPASCRPLRVFIKPVCTLILSFTLTSALATPPDNPPTVAFQAGETTHIIEHLPDISTLAYNTLFWLALNTAPELLSYLALQIHAHSNPTDTLHAFKTSGPYTLLLINALARRLITTYKWFSLLKFATAQAMPVINQVYRQQNCLIKAGTMPVYIMDKALARAFTIRIILHDQKAPVVVFHALKPGLQTGGQKLPKAWRKLFEQLHKLPEPTLHATFRVFNERPVLCLNTISEEKCDIYLPIEHPSIKSLAIPWDILMAELWCPHYALKSPEQGHSIFSRSVIDTMASALATPQAFRTLPMSSPGKVSWLGGSAVLRPATTFDYQVGWSGMGLNPASPGYMVLASPKSPGLTPETMEHPLSNWIHWIDSYQKPWSATPAQWLPALFVNPLSIGIRQQIYARAFDLIRTTYGKASGDYWLYVDGPGRALAEPLETGKHLIKALTSTKKGIPNRLLPTLTEMTALPDYSSWGFAGKHALPENYVLTAHSFDTESSGPPGGAELLTSGESGFGSVSLLAPGLPVQLNQPDAGVIALLAIPSDQVWVLPEKSTGTQGEHPGQLSLFQKLRETNLRRFPFLSDSSREHNEATLSSYKSKNIVAIIVTESTPLLAKYYSLEPLQVILEEKQKFEQMLGLKPLPVCMYNQALGRIVGQFNLRCLSELKEKLTSLHSRSLRLGCSPLTLPVFFDTWPFDKYLKLLTLKIPDIRNTADSAVPMPPEELDKLHKLIMTGETDEPFFNSLAAYPAEIMHQISSYREPPGTPAEVKKIIYPVNYLTLIAHSVPTSSASEFIKSCKARTRIVSEIIDKAGLSEPFSRVAVHYYDITHNPYAALDWVTNRHCCFEPQTSGQQYLQAALKALSLKSAPGEGDSWLNYIKRKYFNEVVLPLYRKLLKTGKLDRALLEASIIQGLNNVLNTLTGYVYSQREQPGLEDPEAVQQFLEQRVPPPPRPATLTELKDRYSELATLMYLHLITYGRPKKAITDQLTDIENYFLDLSSAMNDVLQNEVRAKAFYPVNDRFLKEIIQPNKATQSLSPESTASRPRSRKKRLLTVRDLRPGHAKMMLSPDQKQIKSMLSLIDPLPDWANITPSIPEEPVYTTPNIAQAMTPPYDLASSMAASPDKQLQQVIEHYYLNPNPVHITNILEGRTHYEPNTPWRNHHGIDHVARTVVILEATVQLCKQFKPEYTRLFEDHPDLDRLLPLAMVYYDAGAEIVDEIREGDLASALLTQDLGHSELSAATIELVVSALKNKNVNTMNPVPEEYTPDNRVSPDERLIRRLLRLSASVDSARTKTVSDDLSFAPPTDSDDATADSRIYSMEQMDLDPDLLTHREFLADWSALMKTAVFWASLTGASPDYLKHPDPAKLMPYAVNPNLEAWTREISRQRRKIITRAPDSLVYTREILHDITRLFIAQEAGKTVTSFFQLRQIKLPENWSVLDSFLHFTDDRKKQLELVIDFWTEHDFPPQHFPLPGSLLSEPTRQVMRRIISFFLNR